VMQTLFPRIMLRVSGLLEAAQSRQASRA